MEPKLVKLSCLSCGANLSIGPDIDVFACQHCGSEQRVSRGDGLVSLKLVTNAIKEVQRGTDKTAAELAIVRLNKEIEELKTQKNTFLDQYGNIKSQNNAKCAKTIAQRNKERLWVASLFSILVAIITLQLLEAVVSAFSLGFWAIWVLFWLIFSIVFFTTSYLYLSTVGRYNRIKIRAGFLESFDDLERNKTKKIGEYEKYLRHLEGQLLKNRRIAEN